MIGAADAEAMKIRAQALAEFNDSAILHQTLEILPEFARIVSEPLSRTSEIVINSSTNEATLVNGLTNFLTQVPASVKALSGIDINSYLQGKLSTETKAV